MALQLDDIETLFLTGGAALYGGESITQLQHALQCAHHAERAGATPELVCAALLHDLGHLLTPAQARSEQDDLHQFRAVPFLRGVVPDAVIEPMRLHVEAKRYLCAVDSAYHASLSPASQRSLALQGHAFTPAQAAEFMAQPFAADAVALRRWDDFAKDPQATPPTWAHYKPLLASVSAAHRASVLG
jgi:phosphonate degradation associated HDIG domain protein